MLLDNFKVYIALAEHVLQVWEVNTFHGTPLRQWSEYAHHPILAGFAV